MTDLDFTTMTREEIEASFAETAAELKYSFHECIEFAKSMCPENVHPVLDQLIVSFQTALDIAMKNAKAYDDLHESFLSFIENLHEAREELSRE